MTALYYSLFALAAWLWPDQVIPVFMLLVTLAVMLGEAVLLSVILGLAALVDRRRDVIRLADRMALGDHVELPRNLHEVRR